MYIHSRHPPFGNQSTRRYAITARRPTPKIHSPLDLSKTHRNNVYNGVYEDGGRPYARGSQLTRRKLRYRRRGVIAPTAEQPHAISGPISRGCGSSSILPRLKVKQCTLYVQAPRTVYIIVHKPREWPESSLYLTFDNNSPESRRPRILRRYLSPRARARILVKCRKFHRGLRDTALQIQLEREREGTTRCN